MPSKGNFDSDKIGCFTYKHIVDQTKNKIHIIIFIIKSEHKLDLLLNPFCLFKDMLYLALARRSIMIQSMKTVLLIQSIRWMNNTHNGKVKNNH